jgi:hypothetical protein
MTSILDGLRAISLRTDWFPKLLIRASGAVYIYPKSLNLADNYSEPIFSARVPRGDEVLSRSGYL